MGIHVVGMGGSLGRDSDCLHALRLALNAAASAGASTELLDVRELDLPLYLHGSPLSPGAIQLREAVARADAMIWATPLYHGTVSGAVKNAIDYLETLAKHEPPYLTGRFVGLIATAGGYQALQAINTMEYCVRSLRGFTVPLVVPIDRGWQAFTAEGQAVEPRLQQQLAQLGELVVQSANRYRGSST